MAEHILNRSMAERPSLGDAIGAGRQSMLHLSLVHGIRFGAMALKILSLVIILVMAGRVLAPADKTVNTISDVERLAASLPPADADLLRFWIGFNQSALLDIQAKREIASHGARRAEKTRPDDPPAVRAAINKLHMARSGFQDMILRMVNAVGPQMSSAGRRTVAAWRVGHKLATAD
jgi:hypothetical protein